uniref:C2H2-type domain-containing protein n=1 Tax=Heliothis virescens TaxID=7102 RepID=A0A2A4J5J9_HELVI
MLHNTGPYGPNEAPVNMGAPVNMTPISGHMNIAHNINNLSKIAQQGAPAASGHYNLPDYAHYNHSPLVIPSQMGQFPNYQQLGFQNTYMNQNTNNINDLSFTNGMFPMNLNVQNQHNANMINSAYEKRFIDGARHDNIREQNLIKTPLNIPQIPNKSYNRQNSVNNDYIHSNLYQNAPNNLDLSIKPHEKLQINSTRRKNIENTVKLIEDILINSSNKTREPESTPPAPNNTKTNLPSDITIEKSPTSSRVTEIPKTNAISPQPSKELPKEPSNTVNDKPNNTENNNKGKQQSENDSSTDDEDLKPLGIMQHFITEDAEVTTDNTIEIKVEKASWADSDCYTPFGKDCNGFQREGQVNYRIIEGDCSITEAIAAYKNDVKPEGVFECPHCALLFKHPKRFLIHTKWHTFGLTNIKRMEIAKVREQKRFERKEAKIIERMNSKEVTEEVNVDGKTFPCKDCDKVFIAKGSLKNHRQRSHPTRIRECKICHKTISSWMALRAHLATHTADSGPGYQCSECPKRFKYSHSLAKHSDTHLVHERTHRNERPFVCDICNTAFGTNSSLKRHLKVSHSTSKPHQCSICHRNFSTESIRDRHESRLHGKPEDFKFPCKQCACKYLKLKDLQKHVYKMHPKGKRKKKSKSSESE